MANSSWTKGHVVALWVRRKMLLSMSNFIRITYLKRAHFEAMTAWHATGCRCGIGLPTLQYGRLPGAAARCTAPPCQCNSAVYRTGTCAVRRLKALMQIPNLANGCSVSSGEGPRPTIGSFCQDARGAESVPRPHFGLSVSRCVLLLLFDADETNATGKGSVDACRRLP